MHYLCTVNIGSINKAYNNKILNNKKQNENYCNCAGSCKYPLKGGNASQKVLSTRIQLYLNLSKVLHWHVFNSDSDMTTIKSILNVACIKMTLSF